MAPPAAQFQASFVATIKPVLQSGHVASFIRAQALCVKNNSTSPVW